MIRRFAASYQYVVLAVKRRYVNTCKAMFTDVSNLGVYPVTDSAAEIPLQKFHVLGFQALTLGDNGSDPHWKRGNNWAAALYEQAGLPATIMRNCFKVPRNKDRERNLFDRLVHSTEPYIFVHDDKYRGFKIPRNRLPEGVRVVTPGLINEQTCPSDCLLDYAEVMERAEAVHVIDSCFAWMQDLLCLNKTAYMHTYAKSGGALCRAVFNDTWKFED
jgi:hypothetical protein